MQAAIDIKVLQTLGMAWACPSPYVKGRRFFAVAGACPRDVERIMKRPQLNEVDSSCPDSSSSPDFDPFGIRRSRTTGVNLI